jgi:hypothetical protein
MAAVGAQDDAALEACQIGSNGNAGVPGVFSLECVVDEKDFPVSEFFCIPQADSEPAAVYVRLGKCRGNG